MCGDHEGETMAWYRSGGMKLQILYIWSHWTKIFYSMKNGAILGYNVLVCLCEHNQENLISIPSPSTVS